jgi:hypothetical protein
MKRDLQNTAERQAARNGRTTLVGKMIDDPSAFNA